MSSVGSDHCSFEEGLTAEMTSKKPVSPDKEFTLFVALPNDRVCTLRHIQSGTTVEQVKGRLELVSGLPSYIYMLGYPDGERLSDRERLLYQENVRDGYLLRAHINENWESLYHSVINNNIETVYHSGGIHLKVNMSISSDEADKIDTMVNERASTALFMACHQGMTNMCNMLLSVGADVNIPTKFGRTAMHAAVCKDHLSIANTLLEFGCSPNTVDNYGQSPVDVARAFNSLQCEKKLRLMQLNLRGLSNSSDYQIYRPISSVLDTRLHRVSSVPNRHSEERTIQRKTVTRPKTTSVSRLPSSSKENHDSNAFVTRFDLKTQKMVSTTDGYWIQRKNDIRAMSDGQEKRLLHFSDNNCVSVNNMQLPMSLNSFKVLKGQKDISNSLPQKYDKQEREFCMTPLITAPPTATIQAFERCASARFKYQGQGQEEMSVSDDHDQEIGSTSKVDNCDTKHGSNTDNESGKMNDTDHGQDSVLKSDVKKPMKSVSFSSKARSVRTYPRSETLETFRRMKRKINISMGKGSSDHTKSDSAKSTGITFEKWCRRKKRLERKLRQNESSSSEDDSDDEGDSEAFREWMKKKKDASYGPPKQITRPISNLIKIGSTELGEGRNPDPSYNIRAYKQWFERKRKNKKGLNVERMKTVEDFMSQKTKLEEKRQQLLMDAISYDDWINHAEDKKAVISHILRADLEQLNALERDNFLKRTPRQLSYIDWRGLASKRQEENRAKLEKQLKYEEEQERLRRELYRTSAAIPHSEWLKRKRGHNTSNSKTKDAEPDPDKTRSLDAEKSYETWVDSKHGEEKTDMLSEMRDGHDVMNAVRHKRINALVACQ